MAGMRARSRRSITAAIVSSDWVASIAKLSHVEQEHEQAQAQISEGRQEGEQRPGESQPDTFTGSVSRFIKTTKPYLELLGLFAVLTIPLSAVRVFAASGFNQNVALAIVANSGTSDLAIGLLILALPMALYLLAMTLATDIGSVGSKNRVWKCSCLFAVVLYISLSSTYWFEPLLYGLFPVSIAVWFYIADREKDEIQSRNENRRFAKSIAASSVVFTITTSSMWLPPERLVVDGHAKLGYVLKDEDQDYVIFFSDKKVVLRVARRDVTERQYCAPAYQNPLQRETDKSLPSCPRK